MQVVAIGGSHFGLTFRRALVAAQRWNSFNYSCLIRTSRHFVCLSVLTILAAYSSVAAAGITGTTLIAEALTPTFATFAPGDSQRMFITEISGNIRVLDLINGGLLATPFLTIPDATTAGEGGLLGMAFHPDYATNGKFYALVSTNNSLTTRIREYTVSANPNIANAAPRQIAEWTKTTNEHNGGWIGFNPAAAPSQSSYLYVTTGDDNTPSNAQLLTNPLGKVLRIDVNGDAFSGSSTQHYAIPASNPFVGGVTADDAIWSMGLRNPWRASFDRDSGDFWIADVGQERIEEVNRQLATSTGGANYGWSRREGSLDYNGGLPLANEQTPTYEYNHMSGCTITGFCGNSIIGGYVYRGSDPELFGRYVFGDFISHNYWSLDPAAPASSIQRINTDLFPTGGDITLPIAFAEDAQGELYILSGGGGVYRIETDGVMTSADFDTDGDIDGRDFITWQRGGSSHWLSAQDLQAWQSQFGNRGLSADHDTDGDIDGRDFLIWQRGNSPSPLSAGDLAAWQANYGKSSLVSANIVVPEPSTWMLLALAASGTEFTRRRRIARPVTRAQLP